MIKRWKANRPKITKDTNIKSYWEVVEKIVSESNVVLEVLDARMPELSRNERLEKMISEKKKKLIFILNKADLVSDKVLFNHFKKLKKVGETFIVSSVEKIGTKRLRDYLFSLGKGSGRFNVGILGYPNTGKSAIINSLVLKKKSKVSSKAGTTHGPQWISLSDSVQIIDSPGVIPLEENDEVRLALIGSRTVEKIKQLDLVAEKIISLFDDKTPIEKLYDVELSSDSAFDIIEEIGKKKKFLMRGGGVDESRVETLIIRDWQSGKLKQ